MLRQLLRSPGWLLHSVLPSSFVSSRRPSDSSELSFDGASLASSSSRPRSRTTSAQRNGSYDSQTEVLPFLHADSPSSSPSTPASLLASHTRIDARAALYIEAALTVGWIWAYCAGLEGGTVQSIQVKLPRLGTDVFLAVVLFTAALHLPSVLSSLRSTPPSYSRIPLPRLLQISQLSLLVLLYWYDHGADLDHHGSYNLAIFSVIAAPLNGLLVGLQLWWSLVERSCQRDELTLAEKDPDGLANIAPKWLGAPRTSRTAKRFSKQVLALTTVATIAVMYELRKYGAMWSQGIFPETSLVRCDRGTSTDPNGVCSPETCDWQPFSAWMDLIPAGSQNIWASPPWARTCKASGPAAFTASLTAAGEVVVNGCPGTTVTKHTRLVRTVKKGTVPGTVAQEDIAVRVLGTYSGPIVQELPMTRFWSWDTKEMEKSNSYQDAILDHLESHTYSAGEYDDEGGLVAGKQAHRVSDETEAVMVKCGTDERIASRVKAMSTAELGALPRGTEANTSKEDSAKAHEPLNVVVVFLDAVARRHLFRRLPKLAATMASMSHSPQSSGIDGGTDLTLVQLFRYLSVGYNTDPTTRALLGGQSRHSIHSLAKPIWTEFAEAGYVTGFAADNCQDWPQRYGSGRMSRTVQGVGKHTMSEGTKGTVTEPQAGTFAAHHEFEAYACMPEFVPILKSDRGNLRGPNAVAKRCIAGKHVHDIQLDWMNDFMRAYSKPSSNSSSAAGKSKRPFFVMGSFMEGHEGTSESIALADESLSRFLDPATSAIPWNNTMVLLVADHGLTLGLGRLYTKQGKVEERNPFGAIMLPDWAIAALSERRSDRGRGEDAARADLTWNEQRLVTAFDLHETMRHVLRYSTSSAWSSPSSPALDLDLTDLRDASTETQRQALVGPASARSILGGPIGDRTCEDVDVEEWLCRCRTKGQGELE